MEVLEGQEPVHSDGGGAPIPSLRGAQARVPPRTVAVVPALVNLPPFRRKTLFRFAPLKENMDPADKLYSLSFRLRHLEGWPSTHRTTNN